MGFKKGGDQGWTFGTEFPSESSSELVVVRQILSADSAGVQKRVVAEVDVFAHQLCPFPAGHTVSS